MDIQIISATLRGGHFLTFSYRQKVGEIFNDVKIKSDAIVHADLKKAFLQLVPHLALICEDIVDGPDVGIAMDDASELNQENATAKQLATFTVQQFTIVDPESEKEGVVIVGKKKLASKKRLTLHAPALRWLENYNYMDDLKAAVDTLRQEVLEYLDGKVGNPPLGKNGDPGDLYNEGSGSEELDDEGDE